MSSEEKNQFGSDLNSIADSLEQIAKLPLDQQPAAFGRVRDLLEHELNNPSAAVAGGVAATHSQADASSQAGNFDSLTNAASQAGNFDSQKVN